MYFSHEDDLYRKRPANPRQVDVDYNGAVPEMEEDEFTYPVFGEVIA